MKVHARRVVFALSALLPCSLAAGQDPGEPGARGLALVCEKLLTAAADEGDAQFVDHAVLLVENGRVVRVGKASETAIPADYERVDVGRHWIMPGMIDLHSHIGGTPDWTTNVYLTNPGHRISTSVVPNHTTLQYALTGGVTTLLLIPGSGTNMGGQGVLFKTEGEHYEDMLIRDPGSLKLAQAGNPEEWGNGVGRTFMNWNTRNTFLRGLAYARRWEEFEQRGGEEPLVDPQWEIFRSLLRGETQVSAHTQMFQVVLMTVTMIKGEFGLDVYIDHGTFDGWRAAGIAEEYGVPAILGPRSVTQSLKGVAGQKAPYRVEIDTDGRIYGVAAKYQESGHRMIGFNTDAIDSALLPPGQGDTLIKAEELSLQAAMAVRYGMGNTGLEAVRGLTIVPAMAAGIDDQLGSLEPGKDADFLILTGDPADPRTSIEAVLIDGAVVRGEVPARSE